MADTMTETPIWGDELMDFMTLGTEGSLPWIEVGNLLSWEFDGDSTKYEPSYINRRVSPTFTLAEKVSISYEKDLYRNNEMDAFLVAHEDDTDIPVRICRVQTWTEAEGKCKAKAAVFLLTPNQLDKNQAGEPIKLKGTLSLHDSSWTSGTFDLKANTFTPDGQMPVTPPSQSSEGEKTLDEMTLDELKAYAAAHNISLTGKTTKPDILAAIKAAEGQAE